MGLVRKVLGNVAQLLLIWPLIWLVLIIFSSISGELGEKTLLEMLCSIPPFDDFSSLVVEIINTIKGEKSYSYMFSSYFEELIKTINNNIAECFIVGLWVYILTNVQEFLLGKKLYPIIATFLGICCGWFTLYLTNNVEKDSEVFDAYYEAVSNGVLVNPPDTKSSPATWIVLIILFLAAYIIGFLCCCKDNQGNIKSAALKTLLIESMEMGYGVIMTALWVTTIIFLPAPGVPITQKVIFCLMCIASLLLLFYLRKVFK